jgi:hypothetical protein
MINNRFSPIYLEQSSKAQEQKREADFFPLISSSSSERHKNQSISLTSTSSS